MVMRCCKDWVDKLDDTLWTYWTMIKTLVETTPFRLVYGNLCHLPVELEHKAYWAIKHLNFDLKSIGKERLPMKILEFTRKE